MASVSFLPEAERPPIDKALEDAAKAAGETDKLLRLRLQPDLYNFQKGAYGAWHGLSWTLDLDDVEEGRRLREGLQDFFRLFATDQAVLLEGLRAMIVEGPARE